MTNEPVTRTNYWWAWAVDPVDQRLIVLGPSDTEQLARQDGFQNMPNLDFTCTELKTRDRVYARDMINHLRLDQGAKIEDMIRKRAKYKI